MDEVSSGVYKVRGWDLGGRNVETTGTDPESLLRECRESASILINESQRG
jgi:hypothetical protein